MKASIKRLIEKARSGKKQRPSKSRQEKPKPRCKFEIVRRRPKLPAPFDPTRIQASLDRAMEEIKAATLALAERNATLEALVAPFKTAKYADDLSLRYVYTHLRRVLDVRGPSDSLGVAFLKYLYLADINCFYCGVHLTKSGKHRKSVDHVRSLRKFGNLLDNLQPCCNSCNASKGALDVYQFIAKMRDTFVGDDSAKTQFLTEYSALRKVEAA